MGQKFKIGHSVRIKLFKSVGEIVEIDKNRKTAKVHIPKNNTHISVPIDQLEVFCETKYKEKNKSFSGVKTTAYKSVNPFIDLHGMRAEEALEIVDKYIDDAIVARMSKISIMHGHGTGTLCSVVRRHLSKNPHVKYFRFGLPFEGGDGRTVVELSL